MDKAQDILRQHHLRITDTRVKLLTFLIDKCHAITADELFLKMRKNIDRSTIFRTLHTFENAGLIKKIQIYDRANAYEYAKTDHHHHLICKECGLIQEIHDCSMNDLHKKLLKKHKNFSKVTEHQLEFFGVCEKCIKE